jgi:formylglycine-generating enzyme required for sulfatase activity
LFDPRKKTETGGAPRRDEEALKDRQYRDVMAAGEALARQGRWKEALDQFENARRLRPTDAQASRRAAFCLRRFNPGMKGFRLLAEDFDPATGLPVRVEAPELGLKMVLVPGGDVEIGDPAFADSRLVHTVHVEPFYLGQYEVTQEQWLRLMASNPSFHQSGFPDHSELPVENVSWLDCQEFLARLNRQVPGAGFRLPTEAEWEYAARRGGTTIPLEEVARYRDNSRIKAGGKGDPSEFAPARVGSKRASNLGLCDMQGNVWEWCSSLFWPYPYDRADGREDPHRDGLRVLRGGAYLDGAELLAVGLRHADRPQQRFRWNGLRLARTVPGN